MNAMKESLELAKEVNPMDQYLQVLRKIKDEGFWHGDRTGKGRRSIYGVQMRFDLTKGFPLDTSRPIFHDGMKKEMLFFIAGETATKKLADQGVKIWHNWTVQEPHIDAFLDKFKPHISEPEEGEEPHDEEKIATIRKAYKENLMGLIGSIGPMYGAQWRNAPGDNSPVLELMLAENQGPEATEAKINELFEAMPSDKKLKLAYAIAGPEFKDNPPEEILKIYNNPSARSQALEEYWKTTDQLANLLDNLRKRPFSSRHRVTAMNPMDYPFENFSPQENVLVGRGALTPCHCIWQCFVSPPKEEGGKLRLSMQMYQSSCDFPVGVPYNISQYALLLSMIAQVVDMEPYEFIWVGGDVHYYGNQEELVLEHLNREMQPLPTLWLNPEAKDLFAFKPEDIEIRDYNPVQPAIKYPVAV